MKWRARSDISKGPGWPVVIWTKSTNPGYLKIAEADPTKLSREESDRTEIILEHLFYTK